MMTLMMKMLLLAIMRFISSELMLCVAAACAVYFILY